MYIYVHTSLLIQYYSLLCTAPYVALYSSPLPPQPSPIPRTAHTRTRCIYGTRYCTMHGAPWSTSLPSLTMAWSCRSVPAGSTSRLGTTLSICVPSVLRVVCVRTCVRACVRIQKLVKNRFAFLHITWDESKNSRAGLCIYITQTAPLREPKRLYTNVQTTLVGDNSWGLGGGEGESRRACIICDTTQHNIGEKKAAPSP